MGEQASQRKLFWPIVLAVLAEIPAVIFVAILTIAIARPGRWDHNLTLTALLTLPVWAVVALTFMVLYRTVLRHRTPHRSFLSLLILIAVPLVVIVGGGALVAHSANQYRAVKAEEFKAAEAKQVNVALDELVRTAELTSGNKYFSIEIHKSFIGEAGRICSAARQLARAIPDIDGAYNNTLRTLGYPLVIAPKLFAAEGGITKARTILASVRVAMDERDREVEAAKSAARQVVVSAKIDATLKKVSLARLDKPMALDRIHRAKIRDIELRLLDEFQNILRDVDTNRSRWQLRGEQLEETDRLFYVRMSRHFDKLTALQREAMEAEKESP
jgi:hypothetical protein